MIIVREKAKISDRIELHSIKEEYPDHSIHNLNISLTNNENLYDDLMSIKDFLDERNLEVLYGFAFGIAASESSEKLFAVLSILYFTGNNHSGPEIQLICVSGLAVEYVSNENSDLSRSFSANGVSQYYLISRSVNRGDPNFAQTYNSFVSLKERVKIQGPGLNNIARTWLYADNILDWYDELNEARTKFFNEEKIFDNLVPASTGIGVGNLQKTAINLSALAIVNNTNPECLQMIQSPLQCSAVDYKSAFSRAIEAELAYSKKLYISGTASIDDSGRTIYIDDPVKQIEQTMEVVSAIFISKGYCFNDMTRAVAYFPDISYADAFNNYCKNNDIDDTYILKVKATVCRPDLLFEIEMDLAKGLSIE